MIVTDGTLKTLRTVHIENVDKIGHLYLKNIYTSQYMLNFHIKPAWFKYLIVSEMKMIIKNVTAHFYFHE